MAVAENAYPTPSLEKGLDILELFASEAGGMTKSEVARRLNRSVSEIFRMLLCLEHRGYIARSEADDRFRLTPHIFRMGQEHPPTKRLVSESVPVMQGVSHTLNQSCHLGMLHDGNVVVIAQTDSPVSPILHIKVGSVVDLMHSTTGYVILAHLPDDARQRTLDRWLQLHPRSKLPEDLDAYLASIRRKGYDERESYETRGVVNFGYPILDAEGRAVSALAIPYLTRIGQTITRKTVHTVLREASEKLSAVIGGRPPSPRSRTASVRRTR